MSDPQRYSLSEPDISYGMDENSNGSYVLWTAYARLKAENARLQAELKFSEHRMIALAEALADTRLGFQKEIEVLKKSGSNPKRDQAANQKDNKGKPTRPGRDGDISRDKPKKSRGTY